MGMATEPPTVGRRGGHAARAKKSSAPAAEPTRLRRRIPTYELLDDAALDRLMVDVDAAAPLKAEGNKSFAAKSFAPLAPRPPRQSVLS